LVLRRTLFFLGGLSNVTESGARSAGDNALRVQLPVAEWFREKFDPFGFQYREHSWECRGAREKGYWDRNTFRRNLTLEVESAQIRCRDLKYRKRGPSGIFCV
jgi:hypothetical protein